MECSSLIFRMKSHISNGRTDKQIFLKSFFLLLIMSIMKSNQLKPWLKELEILRIGTLGCLPLSAIGSY
nr:hypothetical protein Iba_chr13cCG15940 [Ipomoea batatas]